MPSRAVMNAIAPPSSTVANALLARPVAHGTITAVHPSWRDRVAQGAGAVAAALGAGRYGQQRVTGMARDAVDWIPGAGEALGADDVARAVRRRDYVGAGIGGLALAAGMIPVVGDEAAKLLRSARNPAKKLASRSARIYDPPVKSPRAFASDYPNGAATDDAGILRTDIEGRPLGARYIVGRTQTAGRDVALPGEALDPVAEALTGRPLLVVAPSDLGRDVGRARFGHGGTPLDVSISRALTPAQGPRVARHELGHVVDELAGQIPATGLSRELTQVYNTLNTGMERTRYLTGPQHLGYSKADQPREMMAEALRAYMTDPNYLKTVAPKTAARIREFVNPNPRVNKTIQFNSPVAAALVAGGLTAASFQNRGE